MCKYIYYILAEIYVYSYIYACSGTLEHALNTNVYIWLCIFGAICKYIYMDMDIYIYIYVCMHIYYIYADICIYIFIHIYMFERARACAIYECIHMNICIFRNICKYIYIHGYVYISICASIYTIYMRKYMYIHTYTHAQARSSMR